MFEVDFFAPSTTCRIMEAPGRSCHEDSLTKPQYREPRHRRPVLLASYSKCILERLKTRSLTVVFFENRSRTCNVHIALYDSYSLIPLYSEAISRPRSEGSQLKCRPRANTDAEESPVDENGSVRPRPSAFSRTGE